VPHRTNALGLLERAAIQYELRKYQVDLQDLSPEGVAAKIGMTPRQVFNPLVAEGDRKATCLAVIPANSELDLKALAVASPVAAEDRKRHLVGVRQLQALTGYIRGGVTDIGGKKDYPVYADQRIERFDKISVSAGIRGLQVVLAPADYLRITKAFRLPLARIPPRSAKCGLPGRPRFPVAT
jgi:Cys-tRNA(Pro)/Cys-tRNA(Cys) deacylase